MTEAIVDFLRARLDEDERTAEGTLWDGSGNTPDWTLPASATLDTGGDTIHVNDATVARHIVRHDPAHVLRDIAFKRQIIATYEATAAIVDEYKGTHQYLKSMELLAGAAEDNLYFLALVYADHPDYKPEWRP